MTKDFILISSDMRSSKEASLIAFLSHVLPSTGPYTAIKKIPNSKKDVMQHYWFDDIGQLAQKCLQISDEGFDAYFGCATYQQAGGLYKGRTQKNVRSLKAFYLDIDVGFDKKGIPKKYQDAEQATDALDAFCDATGLPYPTVIESGGGIHAWWAMNRELTPGEWEAAAGLLAALIKSCNLEVDPSRTCDCASILRPPETFNRKHPGAPRLVSIRCNELMDTEDADAFIALLRNASLQTLPPALGFGASTLGVDAANIKGAYPPASAAMAAERCAQLRHIRDSHGNVEEPLWYAGLCVAASCQDGDAVAHVWSNGYPGYNPQETEAKLVHAKASPGPTTCKRFNELNPGGCAGCPYADKITSPIQLGVEKTKREADDKSPSQRDRLIEIGIDAELWQDSDHTGYATAKVGNHYESYPLASPAFKRWLLAEYGEQNKVPLLKGGFRPEAPTAQAATEAQAALEALASRGPMHMPAIRVAKADDAIYVDLGREDWSVVKITAQGWQIVATSPVKFLRPKGVGPLPYPVQGGSVTELRRFLNLNEDDFILAEAWLVAAFSPTGPYPLLVLNAEQGAGKSTTSRVLRRLVDPNAAEIRSAPKEERDLLIAAKNSWMLALDNLSFIKDDLSDALCRIATGTGYATRTLHTDTEETIINVCRPVIINGIPDLATRPDLVDRSIVLILPSLPDDRRQSEADFWRDFEAAAPRILGALFNGVACALHNRQSVKLPNPPRMADFAVWAVSASPVMGWSWDAFLGAYNANRANAVAVTIEADAVAVAALT